MHEAGIAQGILDIVIQYVPPDRAHAITGVRVRVGEMAGVMPESLEFCFDAIVAGTPYRSAHLAHERVPTVLACDACGGRAEPDAHTFLCPACHSPRVRLASGMDLQVVDIEIDDRLAEVS